MDTRFYIIVAASSFGLMVVSAIIGNVIGSMGIVTRENLGRSGTVAVLSFYFVLFCVLAYSLVPVLLKTFLTLQVRIGNGGHRVIMWLLGHERAVVYGVWGLFSAGLLTAFALARDEILRHLE